MIEARSFAAYDGDDSYLFVSYAHASANLVHPEMAWLSDAGFNLWFDEGIEVGSVWRRTLATRLSASSGLIFFVTERSVASEHCRNEVHFALDESKPVFVVHLDDTPLPGELRLALAERQALHRGALDRQTYQRRLSDALRTVVDAPASPSPSPSPTTPSNGSVPHGPPTVVVLPFRAVEKEDEGMAATLTFDIIKRLVAQHYCPIRRGQTDDGDLDPTSVGNRYGADYLLSGTAQREGGGRLRLTLLLTETRQGREVGSEHYDEHAANDLDAQDRIAQRFLQDWNESLRFVLKGEQSRYENVADDDLDGWGCLVRSATYAPALSRRDTEQAQALLRRAIALDPDLLAAKVNLARSLAGGVELLVSRDPEADGIEALLLAEESADARHLPPQALPRIAEVIRMFGDEERALLLVEQAHRETGLVSESLLRTLVQCRRYDDALRLGTEADDAQFAIVLSIARAVQGEYETALDILHRRSLETPRNPIVWIYKANALAVLDRYDEARDCLERVRRTFRDWTVAGQETSLRATWHGRDHIVEPLVRGLRSIENRS